MPQSPSVPVAARNAILAWYAANGRRLAFRRTTDPYAILVSEAMSQQTQAARAADHWERFMARFPTIESLAAATPADVLRQWQGLGYNRRALALWRAARVIRDVHGARVPESIEALEALPGVGPYTARAVAAIAFNRPVGAVDVNVRRVLGRIVGGSQVAFTAVEMQGLADATIPEGRAAAWTHALMDLGATVCRPPNPRCGVCPARAWCRFAASSPAAIRPSSPARAKTTGRAVPFSQTSRWLRGRILDRLRAAADTDWVLIRPPIGSHDADRVRTAVQAMAADGVLELDGGADVGPIRARLPV